MSRPLGIRTSLVEHPFPTEVAKSGDGAVGPPGHGHALHAGRPVRRVGRTVPPPLETSLEFSKRRRLRTTSVHYASPHWPVAENGMEDVGGAMVIFSFQLVSTSDPASTCRLYERFLKGRGGP
jgi:hypothetical protein